MQGEFELITNACICTTNNPGKNTSSMLLKMKKKIQIKKTKNEKVEHKVSRKNEIELMYERYKTSRLVNKFSNLMTSL